MPPQAKPVPAQRLVSVKTPGYAWYLLTVLTACYTLSFIDRQILALLVGPIKRDLTISDSQVALLGGLAFALFYTFLGLPLGRVADTSNRRNLVSAGVFVWSCFTAACAAARSFGSLFLCRMGVGVGEATLGPCAYSLIADTFPRERLGLALSIFYMGQILGSSMAQIVGGSVVEAVSKSPEVTVPVLGAIASWRLTFLVLGVPGALFALLVFTLKEPARKNLLQGVRSLSIGDAFKQVAIRWKSVVGLAVAFVFQAACNYGFMFWAPSFFQRVYGWPVGQTGRALGMVVLIFGFAGLYYGGWLCDHWQRKGIIDAPLRVAIPSAIGMGILFPIAMLVPSAEISLAICGLGLFFMAMPMGTAAAALQHIFPNQLRGQVTALYLFILNLGALTLGPQLPAFFSDFVFKNERMIGVSVAITIGMSSILMLAIILATMKPYRRDYLAMHPST